MADDAALAFCCLGSLTFFDSFFAELFKKTGIALSAASEAIVISAKNFFNIQRRKKLGQKILRTRLHKSSVEASVKDYVRTEFFENFLALGECINLFGILVEESPQVVVECEYA